MNTIKGPVTISRKMDKKIFDKINEIGLGVPFSKESIFVNGDLKKGIKLKFNDGTIKTI